MVQEQKGQTVLIVEDDLAIRDVITQILEDEGYPVASAANGLEALNYLSQSSPPRLILLDLMMPIMNGWQFHAQLQDDPILRTIPIIVASADANVQQQAAVMAVPAYLRKPLQLDDLLDAVERFYS